jgi:hypothetical protein
LRLLAHRVTKGAKIATGLRGARREGFFYGELMPFHLRPQGFVFEKWGDWVVAYPITAEATQWLGLIEEAVWPDRDSLYVNYGRVVPHDEWPEFFMEIYHAGWRWSFAEFHENEVRAILLAMWQER